MKITEYKSHFSAQCDRCGHTIFFGRSELKEAFQRLIGGNAYLEFSLGCRCAAERPPHPAKDKAQLELDKV